MLTARHSARKLSAKNVKVARPSLYNYIYTRGEYEKYADELFRLMTDEKFDVRTHKTYSLKDVAQAHQVTRLIRNHSREKNLLTRVIGHRKSKDHGQIVAVAVVETQRHFNVAPSQD